MTAAAEMLQAYLDRSSQAVMTGDFETFRDSVALPFHLVTEVATIVVADSGELRQGFDTFVSMLRTQAVTDYIRLTESAVAHDEALISGRYVTHLMSGAQRVVPPYTSTILLRRENDAWRAVSIANTTRNTRWPIVVLDVDAEEPPQHRRESR